MFEDFELDTGAAIPAAAFWVIITAIFWSFTKSPMWINIAFTVLLLPICYFVMWKVSNK